MKTEVAFDEDILEIIRKSALPDKAEAVVRWLAERCEQEQIAFADYQWKSLINHISAMVDRSVSKEELDIDAELFEGVTPDSLMLAEQTVHQIGNIPESEKYLLSIHFESAKQNIE